MPDVSDKDAFIKILRVLHQHSVEYIVIGGQAESIFGSPRVTYDVDLCYRRTAQNLERLAAALRSLNPKLRGAPPDLPFILDARSLALGSNFTFLTNLGPLDLLGFVEPIGGYEELLARAEDHRVGDLDVKTISLDDLIKVKQMIRRGKDNDSRLQLLAIKEMRAKLGKR
jgi:predicted nucleotidyltransferase